MPTRLAPTVLTSPNLQQFPQRHGHMEPLMLWHRSSRGPRFQWALKSASAETWEVRKNRIRCCQKGTGRVFWRPAPHWRSQSWKNGRGILIMDEECRFEDP